MAITETKRKHTQEFLRARLEASLIKHSTKRVKGNLKSTVTFYNLEDDKFRKVLDDLTESIEEYLSCDFWTKKVIQ